jgi:hypothetical protein
MQLSGVMERLERVVDTAGSPGAALPDLKAALKATDQVQSYMAARRAEWYVRSVRIRRRSPEAAIALRPETPATAPVDEFERTQHLEALALADVILGDAPAGSSSGPPLVVVDASQTDGAGGPVVDWGIPVELPRSVLEHVFAVNDANVIIVANGVVLYAPGQLDLGRTTRLASREQRCALHALYATCAVPGCSVHFDRCRLHHIVFWCFGGRTDLVNLLPVCQHHHTRIHQDGWNITLGPNRELRIELPDGQIMSTGPPKRSAA